MSMTRKLVVALAAISFLAVSASSVGWKLDERKVLWRTGVNSSADTGYVLAVGTYDTSVAMSFHGSAYQPMGVGNVATTFIPDCTIVYFKAIDVTTGADDSVGLTVQIQTLGNYSAGHTKSDLAWSTALTMTTIAEANADSATLGFGWSCRRLDTGTPIAVWYRYIFFGTAAPAPSDTSKIVDMTEQRYVGHN